MSVSKTCVWYCWSQICVLNSPGCGPTLRLKIEAEWWRRRFWEASCGLVGRAIGGIEVQWRCAPSADLGHPSCPSWWCAHTHRARIPPTTSATIDTTWSSFVCILHIVFQQWLGYIIIWRLLVHSPALLNHKWLTASLLGQPIATTEPDLAWYQ